MNGRRLRSLVVTGLRGFVRDRMAFLFAFLFPVVFLAIFGLVFGGGDGTIRPTVQVRGTGQLIDALRAVPALEVVKAKDAAAALADVEDGDAAAFVDVDGASATVDYTAANGTDGPVALAVVQGVVDRLTIDAAGAQPPVALEIRRVEDRSLRYIDFFLPGILAMAVTQSAVFGLGITLVEWRQRRVLRRLRLSPTPAREVVLSRVVLGMVLALVQALFLVLVGWLVFGVHLRGAPWAVPLVAAIGALPFVALGVVVGAVAKSTGAAAGISNLLTLPMVFLAGVFFPTSGAPSIVRAISSVLPLTFLVDSLRDVAVRGHGVAATFPNLAVLLGFTVVFAAIGARVFRWDAD